jgi:hypothetical protein
MKLVASWSNISITILSGICGADVSQKALPFGFDLKQNAVGSLRARMNVVATMVE